MSCVKKIRLSWQTCFSFVILCVQIFILEKNQGWGTWLLSLPYNLHHESWHEVLALQPYSMNVDGKLQFESTMGNIFPFINFENPLYILARNYAPEEAPTIISLTWIFMFLEWVGLGEWVQLVYQFVLPSSAKPQQK